MKTFLLAAWLFFFGMLAAHAEPGAAPALPSVVSETQSDWRSIGDVRFRKWGFHVYDANLWAADGKWAMEKLFALDIRYARTITGKALAGKSVEEMERMNFGDDAKRKNWLVEMERLFPDVQDGDRLVGVHVPGKEARFYNNSKLLGVVADAEFAVAFFSIWLDPRTSETFMRKKLLGLP